MEFQKPKIGDFITFSLDTRYVVGESGERKARIISNQYGRLELEVYSPHYKIGVFGVTDLSNLKILAGEESEQARKEYLKLKLRKML